MMHEPTAYIVVGADYDAFVSELQQSSKAAE